MQESSQQNDIAYDVEHVFNENGREVRKMPIKMGDDTIWVDVKNDGASGNSEDSIMFKLDMEGNGNSNPTVSEARGRKIMAIAIKLINKQINESLFLINYK